MTGCAPIATRPIGRDHEEAAVTDLGGIAREYLVPSPDAGPAEPEPVDLDVPALARRCPVRV
jgi:hypothetical protein